MLELAGALVQSRLRSSEGTVGAVVGYMLGLTNSRMPLNCRSSRTTCVNRSACGLAVSARGPKLATAMRGLFVSPSPVLAWNQSCAGAGGVMSTASAAKRKNENGRTLDEKFTSEPPNLAQRAVGAWN